MSEHAAIPEKCPPFMALSCEHHFRADLLAREAGVDEETVYTMLRWRPVEAQDAAKVLAILSRIYGRDYNLETVWVKLKGDNHAPVEVTTPRL